MTVTISMKDEIIEKVKREAAAQHRSFSGQVAFFCEQGVLNQSKPSELSKNSEEEEK